MNTLRRYFNNNPAVSEALLYGTISSSCLLMLGLILWMFNLGFVIVGTLELSARLLKGTYRFAGWTLFGFAPMLVFLMFIACKRLDEPVSAFHKKMLELIELMAYGLGLLGTLHNLKLAAQGAGLNFQSAMSAFNPLEIGIALWLLCQIVGLEFPKKATAAGEPHLEPNPEGTQLTQEESSDAQP